MTPQRETGIGATPSVGVPASGSRRCMRGRSPVGGGQPSSPTRSAPSRRPRAAECGRRCPAGVDGRRFPSFEHAEHETLQWIGFYNHERLHESLGDVPPAEYEQTDQSMITRKTTSHPGDQLTETPRDPGPITPFPRPRIARVPRSRPNHADRGCKRCFEGQAAMPTDGLFVASSRPKKGELNGFL
jgi:hypothetical protein